MVRFGIQVARKHRMHRTVLAKQSTKHTHTQIEAELNRTQPKPLMQFSFNHELMKLFAIVLFFLNNSTL